MASSNCQRGPWRKRLKFAITDWGLESWTQRQRYKIGRLRNIKDKMNKSNIQLTLPKKGDNGGEEILRDKSWEFSRCSKSNSTQGTKHRTKPHS